MVAAFASATKQRGRPAGGWARYMHVAATLLLCVTLVMWAKPGDASISSKPVPQQPKSIILLESPTHPDATPTSSVDGGQSGDALQASSGGSGEREEGEDEGVNGGGENSSTGEGGGSNPGGGGSPGRGGSKAPRKVRVGWMSNVFHDRPLSGLSIHEAVRVASDNTGNMVLAYGAWQLLDHQRVEVVHVAPPPYKIDVAAVLIPTANLLFDRLKYSGSQMVGMTNMMLNITRSNRVPSALLGIGSQVEFTQPLAGEEGAAARAKRPTADFSAADKVQLPPTQVALLQRVVDSGGFISTRGAFTARILEANGLPPPLPLGCPSLFLNHNPALGAELQRKWNAVLAERSTSLRLAVTLPAISHRTDMPPYVDMLAVRVLKRFPNSVVVLQTEADAFSLERLHAKHDVYVPVDRVRYFYDPRSWVEGLAACCDFAFGFRIHGMMAALAAGVPGIVVSKDYRIKELAEGMALPTVDMLDFLAAVDLDKFDLFDFMASVKAYNARGFDAHRAEVAAEYVRQFEKLGVPLNPEMAAMAGAAPTPSDGEAMPAARASDS